MSQMHELASPSNEVESDQQQQLNESDMSLKIKQMKKKLRMDMQERNLVDASDRDYDSSEADLQSGIRRDQGIVDEMDNDAHDYQ